MQCLMQDLVICVLSLFAARIGAVSNRVQGYFTGVQTGTMGFASKTSGFLSYAQRQHLLAQMLGPIATSPPLQSLSYTLE
jgi:hypothetical protein